MKKILKKVSVILGYIYGIGIALALFVGGLSVIGYVVALCIGGQVAADISHFIYKGVYPILFYFAAIVVLVGLLKMYLNGDAAFSIKGKKKKEKQSSETASVNEPVVEQKPDDLKDLNINTDEKQGDDK